MAEGKKKSYEIKKRMSIVINKKYFHLYNIQKSTYRKNNLLIAMQLLL